MKEKHKKQKSLLQVIYPQGDRPVNGHNGHLCLSNDRNEKANFLMQVHL